MGGLPEWQTWRDLQTLHIFATTGGHTADIYASTNGTIFVIDQIWLVLLAFGAGTAGSLVGFGAGIMISPVLAFLGFSPTLIASNSLFGTFGNLSGATLTHAVRRKIKYSLGLKLGLVAVPGSIAGAVLDQYAEPDLFNILLGIILAISAYMLLRGKVSAGQDGSARRMAVMMIPASISAGIVSSFFGIGGGVVIVPFMVLGLGMRMKEVAIASQPALLVIAFVGVLVHGYLGHPDITQAVLLLAGGFAGGLLGVRLSQRLGGKQMRIILSVLIFSAAARLLWVAAEDAYHGVMLALSRGPPGLD